MNQDSAKTSGTSPTFEPLLDQEQVGALLGLHAKTVLKLTKEGLPAIRIGRFYRFRASQINQ